MSLITVISKEALLWNEYINLESTIQGLTYEQYENIRQMIEVEEIVNAIQYCIDLGCHRYLH